jgi:Uma2 family endonuclease
MVLQAPVRLRDITCPALESGDHLTPAEFDWRYERRHDIKAELIKGVVYVSSPVRIRQHGAPDSILGGVLSRYAETTRGVESASNSTVLCADGSRVQPDHLLRYTRGGTSRVNADGYLEGVPELVAEVAASSAAYDLHEKMDLYAELGVRQYIVWLAEEERITWYALRNGACLPLAAGADGLTHSEVFPGLAIDLRALVERWLDEAGE